MKKIVFSSMALALALVACEDEKTPETPKALGTEVATPAPAPAPVQDAEPANPAFKAKVRKVIGETDLQRKSSDSWKKLRQGQNVFELDRIRTAKESETLLGVNDGSVITVSENSDVTINAEIINELSKKVAITINNGKIYFDVQKQKDGNTIEFRTGTATAAIRGTAGFVGSVDGQTVASLKEGRLAVTSETNESAEIVENQTVLVNKTGKTKSLKLKSSGTKALATVLDSIVTASAQNENVKVDEATLQKSLESFDKSYAKKQAAFEKNSYFLRDKSVPDTVYAPSVTLKAKATAGITVTILGESQVVGDDGVYTYEGSWDASEFGVKRFLVNCSNGEVEYQCGIWTIIYAEPKAEEPAVDTVAAEPVKQEPVAAPKAKEKVKKEEPKPVEQPKVEPKKEEPKVEPKKEEPKPISLKVSIGGASTERIHNPFGRNPRVNGYKGKTYKGNLRVKLSGITDDQLSEIASVKVLRNGDEDSEVTPKSTSFNVPVSVDVNTVADYEVVVTLKNGKTSKSNKKTYEVFCNARVHDPNDLTKYNGGPIADEEQEYQSVQLKRD